MSLPKSLSNEDYVLRTQLGRASLLSLHTTFCRELFSSWGREHPHHTALRAPQAWNWKEGRSHPVHCGEALSNGGLGHRMTTRFWQCLYCKATLKDLGSYFSISLLMMPFPWQNFGVKLIDLGIRRLARLAVVW